MSQRSLQTFLEKLHKELSRKSEIYRTRTSDVRVHNFSVNRKELVRNTLDQIKYEGIILRPREVRHIVELTNRYYEQLRKAFTTGNKNSYFKTVSTSSKEFQVIIKPRKKSGGGKTSAFGAIQTVKRNIQDAFYRDLFLFYESHNKWFDDQRFLDVTHLEESAVSRQQVSKVAKKLKGSEAFVDNQDLLNELSIDLTIFKDDNQDAVFVSLGSSFHNRNIDSPEEKAFKKEAQATIKNAIKDLDIPNLTGSDSFMTKNRKTVLRDALGRFAKVSGITITSEDTKPKRSSKNKVTKRITPKVTSAGNIPLDNDLPDAPKPSRVNLQSLVPVINQRLTEAVAANMGSPKLNYRTGRFATSVKVTDIAVTAKGHPSIGYTYMKDPYQVFEYPGGSPRLATVDRDPRNIISQSIREVAVGIIEGRFFTRRV